MARVLRLAAVLAVASAAAAATPAAASPLDPSFDGDGLATAGLFTEATPAPNQMNINDVAVQSDGKVVVVGSISLSGSSTDFAVARLNADGSPDTSFSGDGRATVDLATTADVALAVAIQPADGKIVVAGRVNPTITDEAVAAARLNPDGTLDVPQGSGDNTPGDFSVDGKQIYNLVADPLNDTANDVVIQPSGKIVIGGEIEQTAGDSDMLLMRLNADGTQDTAGFGTGGIATAESATATSPRQPYDDVTALEQQADGKLVAGGQSNMGDNTADDFDFSVARFSADGALDTNADGDPSVHFGTDGKVTTPVAVGTAGSLVDEISGLAVQSDGKIVATGPADDNFATVRYTPAGDLNDSGAAWGATGIVRTSAFAGSGDETPNAVVVQPNGRVVVGGSANVGTGSGVDFALYRYGSDGILDPSFDFDGVVTTAASSAADRIEALALAPGSKLVAAGGQRPVARYHQNDADSDGAADGADNCEGLANAGQANNDGDAQGDACDGDDDNDGVPDGSDNCPSQANATADGCPAPQPPPDTDGDGIADPSDACPAVSDAAAPRDPRTGCPADPPPIDPNQPTNGNDTINGTAAGETLCGLLGNDTINGLAGNDTLFGDACNDKVKLSASQAGTDGNDNLKGGAGDDSLFGAGGKDKLDGGDGNDKLDGGAGNDSLTGAAGKDSLKGGAGNDKLSGGAAADKLDGGAGNDTLSGGAAKNSYKGGAGNDTLSARNGVRETVDCGAGSKDKATVDRTDTVKGCESVKRP